MINSRSIDDLTPEAQAKYHEFEQAMTKAGIRYIVTCTYRDQESQDWIYASGRKRPGPILTKVTHSPHTARIAWDIAVLDANGKVSWTIGPEYRQAAQIGASLGLIAGGLYEGGWLDYPHFNLPQKPWDKE